MRLFAFHPLETSRFFGCCGGSKDWCLVCINDEWFWELGSSWGQAHIADLIILPTSRFECRIDLTNSAASTATIALVEFLRKGRLGIDGLPFRARTKLNIALSKGSVSISNDSGAVNTWPISDSSWNSGPLTLRVEQSALKTTLCIDEMNVGALKATLHRPALLMLQGNGGGGGNPSVRFGRIGVATS